MWLVREREREEELKSQQPPEDESEKFFNYPRIPLWKQLLYDRRVQCGILLVATAALLPTLIMYFMGDTKFYRDKSHTCSIVESYRVPCGHQNTTYNKCKKINCCFDARTKSCYHFLPSKYIYGAEAGWDMNKPLKRKSPTTPFGSEMYPDVYFTFKDENPHGITISLSRNASKSFEANYNFNADYTSFVYIKTGAIEIQRKGTKQMLLSTSRGPLITSRRYWEWTVDLNCEHLFGMDVLHFDNKTTTRVIYNNEINHGNVVKFLAYANGKFHGLRLDTLGLLEVTVLPSKLIVVRMLSGDNLNFRLSVGPTPGNVLKDQMKVAAVVPPFWMLGVHICRGGIMESLTDALAEFEDFTDKMAAPGNTFPYDSDCLHDNMFSFSMNATDSEASLLQSAVERIHANKRRFVMSLSPQIAEGQFPAFTNATRLGILYRSGGTLNGSYLEQRVSFPDLRGESAQQWYSQMYLALPADGDAFVLKSNWPENTRYVMEDDGDFQYMTEEIRKAMSKTIPWDSESNSTDEHITVHNAYGQDHLSVMSSTTQNKYILTASHTSSNPFGIHRQNLNISWSTLKTTMKQIVSTGMFINQMNSYPICGSTEFYDNKTNEALCAHWYTMAALSPLFRISSELPRRDPSNMPSGLYSSIAKKAIELRYSFLPYLYTIILDGSLVLRPMFFDFYSDPETFRLDEQYMVGDAILSAYTFVPEVISINVYFPEVKGGWYLLSDGTGEMKSGWKTISYMETDFIMYIAAGHIVTTHEEISMTANETRFNPWRLLIALDCSLTSCDAKGRLCISDPECLQFSYSHDKSTKNNTLYVQNVLVNQKLLCGSASVSTSFIGSVRLYGMSEGVVSKSNLNLDLCSIDTSNGTFSFIM